jgi:hypothetical protein
LLKQPKKGIEMSINRRQKVIVVVTLLVIAVMLLFPPWHYYTKTATTTTFHVHCSYKFVGTPPKTSYREDVTTRQPFIDLQRLYLQCASVAIIGAALVLLNNKKATK